MTSFAPRVFSKKPYVSGCMHETCVKSAYCSDAQKKRFAAPISQATTGVDQPDVSAGAPSSASKMSNSDFRAFLLKK